MTNSVRICVPVCARSAAELERDFARAAAAGDTVEVRLDCLPQSEFEKGLQVAKAALAGSERAVIVTLRPAEEGGQRNLDVPTRQSFWAEHRDSLKSALIDVELDLVEHFSGSSPALWHWPQVICSHHDFHGPPGEVAALYERMARTPARVLKIAFQANEITDCLAVFDLLARAQKDGRALIAIAMGAAGICTRILGPSRGAFLTYGALATERGTAPGQPTARELREVYRIHEIDKETMITGLVGLPVGHSLSPHIHNAAFAALRMNAVYLPFEVHDASAFMRRMVHSRTRELDWNLQGLSVTAPHKAAVMESLDWTELAAREIGAVNTIVAENGELHGYNTDAMAVLQPVIEKLGPLSGTRCAILGAGGAASAVLWSLRNAGAKTTLFARDEERGRVLANNFGAGFERLGDVRGAGFDLLINATPLGTRGALEDLTVATAEQLGGARLAYDLVYNPGETKFMREARAAGCDTIGGLEMLVLQAAAQFRLWTRSEPPIEVMREAARRALSGQGG